MAGAAGGMESDSTYRIVIKTSPNITVAIDGNSEEELQSYISYFLDNFVKDNTTQYYMEHEVDISHLSSCSQRPSLLLPHHCPLIFDSLACFNSTPAGSQATAPCQFGDHPVYSDQPYWWTAGGKVTKDCDSTGQWWRHPDSNITWSDYSGCAPSVTGVGNAILLLNMAGLTTSLLLLLLSLAAFSWFRALQCGRVTMHKHLVLSLLLSSSSWLTFYSFVFFGFNGVPIALCQVLHVATTYSMLSTYFWMLCEGLYLQLVLLSSLHTEGRRVALLSLLGWGLPLLLVTAYYALPVKQLKTDFSCWEDFRAPSWFLSVPVLLVFLLNIFFLGNVIRMLRSKLAADTRGPLTRRGTRAMLDAASLKQARAALFLVPILGLNFLLLPIRPGEESGLTQFYDILSAVFASFQGVAVSFLLCFTNSEVLSLVRTRVHQYLDSNNLNTDFMRLGLTLGNSRSDNAAESV